MIKRDKLGRFLQKSSPWNKNKIMNQEYKEKLEQGWLNLKKNKKKYDKIKKDNKAKILKFLKENPDFPKKHSLYLKKYWNKHKEKWDIIKKHIKESWSSQDKKEQSRKLKEYFKSEGARLKDSIAVKKYYDNNPQMKKYISIMAKKRMKNPEARKEISRKMNEFWDAHPNLKKEKRKKMKKHFENNPLALRDLLLYSKKSVKHHITTKQGFIVMSKGEQYIANFLFLRKLQCSYESLDLDFTEKVCIPDFFLTKKFIIIEFYGGHPKSWKSKVEKNILYEKYNIPIIKITPSELINLDKYLISEIKRIESLTKLSIRKRIIERWSK